MGTAELGRNEQLLHRRALPDGYGSGEGVPPLGTEPAPTGRRRADARRALPGRSECHREGQQRVERRQFSALTEFAGAEAPALRCPRAWPRSAGASAPANHGRDYKKGGHRVRPFLVLTKKVKPTRPTPITAPAALVRRCGRNARQG